jgi:hypothetical protein
VDSPCLLGQVLERVAPRGSVPASAGERLAVPTGLLERLAPRGSREFEAMVDCLTDGPPQHALANVAILALLAELLARLEQGAHP